jgi:hypothetical protein
MVRDAPAALLTMRTRRFHSFSVMPGHSRSKNGVLKDAYDPGIHEAVLQARNYVACVRGEASWITGSSPVMTAESEARAALLIAGVPDRHLDNIPTMTIVTQSGPSKGVI